MESNRHNSSDVTGVPEIERMCSYYCTHAIVGLLRVSVEGRRYPNEGMPS